MFISTQNSISFIHDFVSIIHRQLSQVIVKKKRKRSSDHNNNITNKRQKLDLVPSDHGYVSANKQTRLRRNSNSSNHNQRHKPIKIHTTKSKKERKPTFCTKDEYSKIMRNRQKYMFSDYIYIYTSCNDIKSILSIDTFINPAWIMIGNDYRLKRNKCPSIIWRDWLEIM